MIAYIAQIEKYAREQRGIETAQRELRLKLLHLKIQEWWNLRSSQQTTVKMDELVREFIAAPGLIGNALHHLGWQRKRMWGTGGYRRYWVAPIQAFRAPRKQSKPAIEV